MSYKTLPSSNHLKRPAKTSKKRTASADRVFLNHERQEKFDIFNLKRDRDAKIRVELENKDRKKEQAPLQPIS